MILEIRLRKIKFLNEETKHFVQFVQCLDGYYAGYLEPDKTFSYDVYTISLTVTDRRLFGSQSRRLCIRHIIIMKTLFLRILKNIYHL